MYNTYKTDQQEIVNLYGAISPSETTNGSHKARKPKTLLPKPEFMPAKLVRISDMCVVAGSHVNEGYCALSYCWAQSGEIKIQGASGRRIRVDMGNHRIIYPGKITQEKSSGRKRYHPPKTKFVKFRGLIQHICIDFGVRYLWCDMMCIDQEDRENKLYEIKCLHRIFANASFMVALVPELRYIPNKKSDSKVKLADMDALSYSQWSRRIWILEEAFIAKKILFVGHNVYM
ncbi:hypothetical protein BDA99DRAFT_78933 [Phascolomyces articulosus]|uniref:Heterokaryon incompatibility domain-containing protein n=1 Tax=Phascolomyces articulosus TaxID=60185 RepID=A0AAD5K954_9FUNG|nr:hypothetical protein BDA99DRAFT_78933 [Phascolomyces articulosus]